MTYYCPLGAAPSHRVEDWGHREYKREDGGLCHACWYLTDELDRTALEWFDVPARRHWATYAMHPDEALSAVPRMQREGAAALARALALSSRVTQSRDDLVTCGHASVASDGVEGGVQAISGFAPVLEGDGIDHATPDEVRDLAAAIRHRLKRDRRHDRLQRAATAGRAASRPATRRSSSPSSPRTRASPCQPRCATTATASFAASRTRAGRRTSCATRATCTCSSRMPAPTCWRLRERAGSGALSCLSPPLLEAAALDDRDPRVAQERRVRLRASAEREDRAAAVRHELLVDAGVAEARRRRRADRPCRRHYTF